MGLVCGRLSSPQMKSVPGPRAFKASNCRSTGPERCLSSFLDPRHENSPNPLLRFFTKTCCRSRYRDYIQWRRICLVRPWRGPSYPICHKASIPPTSGPCTEWWRMRYRYLKTPNVGSAKIPSTLYYDRNGNFCGIENGEDFQDDKEFLRIRWWGL